MEDELQEPRAPVSAAGGLKVAAFGLLLLFGGWAAGYDAGRYAELHEDGTRVEAEVVDTRTFDSGGSGTRSTEYRATIEFTTTEGQRVTGEAKISEEVYDSLQQGGHGRIPIVYMPDDPEGFRSAEVNVDEKTDARVVSWVMRVLGALVVLAGIVMVYRARAASERPRSA